MPPKKGKGRGRGGTRDGSQPDGQRRGRGVPEGRAVAIGRASPQDSQYRQASSRGRGRTRHDIQEEKYETEGAVGIQRPAHRRLEEFPSLLPEGIRDHPVPRDMPQMPTRREPLEGPSAEQRDPRITKAQTRERQPPEQLTVHPEQTPLQHLPEHGAIPKREKAEQKALAKGLMQQMAKSPSSEQALQQVGLRFQSMDISSHRFPPRTSYGTKGRKIALFANYFEIDIPHGEVYHYDVEVRSIRRDMSAPGDLQSKPIKKYKCLNTRHNRNVIEEMLKQVGLFSKVRPAYDGEKNLYTRNPLPIKNPMTFTVKMMEDADPDRPPSLYEIAVQPVNKEGQTTPMISLEPLHQLWAGNTNVGTEEIRMGIMALETILRHGPALRLVPVGRSFFHNPREEEIPPLSGGREIWMGYHQGVRISKWKPMINIDMSATTFYKSGPVIEYMLDILYPYESEEYKRQQLSRIRYLSDAQRVQLGKELKTLRIEVNHLPYPRKYRISGISQHGADNTFFMREAEGRKEKISVSDYFRMEYRRLQFPNLPCLDVGSSSKNIYLPLEVCNIIEGQHCKKKLSDKQTADMIRYTAIPPAERFRNIQGAIQQTREECRPFSTEFGIRINTNPTRLEGRVLEPPHVMYDRQEAIMPNNGCWDMRGKHFFFGQVIGKWILISFSTARWCDRAALENFAGMLRRGGEQVGMNFDFPASIESFGGRVAPGDVIKKIKRKEDGLQLVVVILPSKGPSNIYSEIKSVAETELGLMTQCVKDANVTGKKCNPQLICNLCQKINAKMGGINNSLLPAEKPPILKRPVIIVGADCSHPAPGDKIKPSIAAVVGSLDGYPSRYKASVRVQESKVLVEESKEDKPVKQEIIMHLKEMMKEILEEFYRNTKGKKPEKIIFYRDGVSEGEFEKVVEKELSQVRQACEVLNKGEEYKPPITFIIVGKRHHTRFVPQNRRDGVGKCGNVPPGTTVDTVVTHPVDTDFFMCSHAGIQGTSRPAHYTVLWDDNNLNADELQTLTYFLCHTYVRCTRSISVPCPVMYAHLAAFRAKQYLIYKSEGMSSSGSESSKEIPAEIIKESTRVAANVVEKMQNTMYFV